MQNSEHVRQLPPRFHQNFRSRQVQPRQLVRVRGRENVQGLAPLHQALPQPGGNGRKARHAGDHLGGIPPLFQALHHIAIRRVSGHIPQHDHGHVCSPVQIGRHQVRVFLPSGRQNLRVPRHGEGQGEQCFPVQVHRLARNGQRQLLPRLRLGRSNDRAGLQHAAGFHRQEFRVAGADAHPIKYA